MQSMGMVVTYLELVVGALRPARDMGRSVLTRGDASVPLKQWERYEGSWSLIISGSSSFNIVNGFSKGNLIQFNPYK